MSPNKLSYASMAGKEENETAEKALLEKIHEIQAGKKHQLALDNVIAAKRQMIGDPSQPHLQVDQLLANSDDLDKAGVCLCLFNDLENKAPCPGRVYYCPYQNDHTPATLLEFARRVIDDKPKFGIRRLFACNAIWIAAVQSLKLYANKVGVEFNKHEEMSEFVSIVIYPKGAQGKPNQELAHKILYYWESANKAHKDEYRSLATMEELSEWYENVKQFCAVLPQLPIGPADGVKYKKKMEEKADRKLKMVDAYERAVREEAQKANAQI